MLIKARLKGHDFDLITLTELFREGDPAVVSVSEGYYLSFAAPDAVFDDGARLYEAASSLLHRVNGVGCVRSSEFRPVHLEGSFRDQAGRQHAVALAGTAEARARAFALTVTTGGQHPPAPLPPGPGDIRLARTDRDVAEVLEILGKADPAPNWTGLYKVLEIVCQNTSGRPGLKGLSRLKKMGWVPPAQLDAFKTSANHQAISGDQARHARMMAHRPPSIS